VSKTTSRVKAALEYDRKRFQYADDPVRMAVWNLVEATLSMHEAHEASEEYARHGAKEPLAEALNAWAFAVVEHR